MVFLHPHLSSRNCARACSLPLMLPVKIPQGQASPRTVPTSPAGRLERGAPPTGNLAVIWCPVACSEGNVFAFSFKNKLELPLCCHLWFKPEIQNWFAAADVLCKERINKAIETDEV